MAENGQQDGQEASEIRSHISKCGPKNCHLSEPPGSKEVIVLAFACSAIRVSIAVSTRGVHPKRFQLMLLGMKTNRRLRLNIEGKKLNATDHVELLGIEIDSILVFSIHVEALCYKVNKKITAFSRPVFFIPGEAYFTLWNFP